MRLTALILGICLCLGAQDRDARQRERTARDLGKGGSENIPQLVPMLEDGSNDVRLEAVKAIVGIGTQHSLDPLIHATRDNDAEIQLRATDGLVNFYLPGYVQSGISRLTSNVRSRFDRENTQVVDPYITVRPEVIAALGKLARGGVSMDVRANAARAIGILRGREAVPDLIEALQSKDDNLIFESLIALQKIGDPAAGPRVTFLVRDLHERVQIAAVQTVGLLKVADAVPNLQNVFETSSSDKVRAAALTSLAMIAQPDSRPLFQRGFNDRNDAVRAAAAEGYGRLGNMADRPTIEQAFNAERKMPVRLAQAFALVSLGHRGSEEFAPLTYLVNTLNSKGYRDFARAYLVELAREPGLRGLLHSYLQRGLREEKIGLLQVLASSGDLTSAEAVEPLTKDPDSAVAQEAIRTLRTLRSRG